jgi:hypothetical protein
MKPSETLKLESARVTVVPKDKAVRFAVLAETSGKPEVVTLWADPKKDESFMDFVKKRRVITVVQKPIGNKKDVGYIGFHPQPFAVFMVFPKPLKPRDGSQIIGIKYDLLATVDPKKDFKPRIIKAPSPIAKKPVTKIFHVHLQRTLSQAFEEEVSAFNLKEARKTALSSVGKRALPVGTIQLSMRVTQISEGD